MTKGTSIGQGAGESTVLVRLILLACDDATGEERIVGSLLKSIPMPPRLAPGMTLALDIFGERRLFHPTDILWDDARRVRIVEVEWRASDAARSLDTVKVHALSGRQRGVSS
jgi:hypothetical protein